MRWHRLYRIPMFMGSRTFLLMLMSIWVIYYVTMSIWSKEAFATFVTELEHNIYFQTIALLFLSSFIIYIAKTAIDIAKRHKWLVLFWILFPSGIAAFTAGFFMNSFVHSEGTIVVGEGDTIAPPWERSSHVLRKIEPGLKDELLAAGGSESVIFAYEPKIVLGTPNGDRVVGIFPPTKIGSTYYHLLDFGLAPGIRLSHNGKVLIQSYVIQRILPPGSMDSFLLEPYPYKVELRLAPSRRIQKGETEASVYSLTNLKYKVLVYRGEELVFDGVTEDGITFDGLMLEVTPHTYWVRLEAARRPGMIPMVTGISLIILGLPFWTIFLVIRLIQRDHGRS